MNPNIFGVIGPGFLNQVPTLSFKKTYVLVLWAPDQVVAVCCSRDTSLGCKDPGFRV